MGRGNARLGRGVGAVVVLLIAVLSSATTASSSVAWWVPAQGLHWQYQLQGKVVVGRCAVRVLAPGCAKPDVYDIDLYANDGVTPSREAVSAIHAAGAHAVCYVDAGTWEDWRPDASEYPASVKGLPNGWPGERWLDIRATTVLMPILDARVAKCGAAGFDAVEFDNVDGYLNNTGYPLSATDQLNFNIALATMAHAHQLGVGLKNDLDQLDLLQSSFDFAINEQCAQFRECNRYDNWTQSGKAVAEVEYRGRAVAYCKAAATGHRDAFHKSLALRATPWRPCR